MFLQMNKNVLVSIWCLAYNHAPYIRQCLEGFVIQKTDFIFEAIVHDDASTDGTADIIKEYAEKYPDIIKPIFETENQYSKRNGAIRRKMNAEMRGKYIAMCEGDDYWTDPYKLQKQVEFLENNTDFVFCYHNALNFDGKIFTPFIDLNKESGEIELSELLNRWAIPTASVLYRNMPRDYNGSLFPNGDYAMELYFKSKGRFYYSRDIISVYRRHENSVSFAMNKNLAKTYKDLIFLLESAKSWYPDNDAALFNTAISRYAVMMHDAQKLDKYPFMKYLSLTFYKRYFKKKLGIVRVHN